MIFYDFYPFSAKNWHFSLKSQCYDRIFAKTREFLSKKRQIFLPVFFGKLEKIIFALNLFVIR
jgi:hypothetical protein